MKRAWRRIPWIKLAVVAGLIWFASTRLYLGDRLVASGAPDGALSEAREVPAEVPVILSSGGTIALAVGETLPVEILERDGGIREAWVLTPEGRMQIAVDQIGPEGPLTVRPGLRSSLRGISWGGFLIAILAQAPVPLLLAWRWHLLLHAAGVRIGGWTTLRLTWIGLFFNTVMPGGAGGDLVKLVEVGRYTDRRSAVLSTIAVDRIVGLLVLIGLGLTGALMVGGATSGIVASGVLVGGAITLGFVLYTSSIVRRWIDVEALLSRLPLRDELLRLDQAVVAMRSAPLALSWAAAASLLLQVLVILAAYLAARALGLVAVTPAAMAQIVPIANVANAVPLSPGGLGQLELAFQELMHRQGLSSLAEGFTVGVLVRAISVTWSLPGLPLWMSAARSRPPKEEGSEFEESQARRVREG